MSDNNYLSTPFVNQPLISVVGSGNWGTAVARRLGINLEQRKDESLIKMWVFEELVHGEKLSEIINNKHENVKYLPNISLPSNIRAVPDLQESVKDCNILLFVVPHQFLDNVLRQLKGKIHPDTICVSLIKGMDCCSIPGEVRRYTEIIQHELGVKHVSAIMGANVASDVARDEYVETTVAAENLEIANAIAALFQCSCLRAEVSEDLATVELNGALKNVIALGAGFCDGLGLGASTKAALIRQGLEEMALFCALFDNTGKFQKDTMFLSCGVADLVATCFGGRNRLCAAEFAKHRLLDKLHHASAHRYVENLDHHHIDELPGHERDRREHAQQLWHEIEARLLHGQKLQGVSTCAEVMHLLQSSQYLQKNPQSFPLIRRIHAIAVEGEIKPLWD